MSGSLSEQEILDIAKAASKKISIHAASVDAEERYPVEGHDALREAGLLGLSVQREFGGIGASARAACLVVEEIAAACASTAALLLTWAGPVTALQAQGTEEQKGRYLPAIAEGTCSLSFALTEDHCGSDAGAISTTATIDGGDYILNGKKAWIGNAINADLTLVAAKTDPSQKARGITTFLVEKDTPGVSVQEMYSKMGCRGTRHGDLVLENARVPSTQILGQQGRGLAQMLQSLDYIRLITAAHALGIARTAFEAMEQYARERSTFGSQLYKHQALAFRIADCATQLHAARLVILDAADDLDRGKEIGAKAAMAKLYASEIATSVAHAAVQIHGAWGVKRGNVAERAYRDARVTEIWDGTSEIQRIIIARSIFGRD